ncbi:MAG: hydrogenase maturation nickel metallochaperone HypA [Gemmatimonadetes bacterium]|nr:hydrogenase maturation nickel metallochaperone HypA [Gemmatimonadota bacterium]MCC6772921.1 hydrogenase maturation nickel metallochaperone HypA [Gemmatimonadaceae bacterium]
MHELSLAQGIVEQAVASAAQADAKRVVAVHLKIGRLAGVEPGALLFCYDDASKGTMLEGSRLVIHDVPLVVWCAHCLREVELPGVQSLRCPTCQTPCGEILQGRELQIESLEIEP